MNMLALYNIIIIVKSCTVDGIPSQHSKYCAHNKSHNEGDVLDGIDLHSSCVWIQTEVVREVEAKETAQVEHLHRFKGNSSYCFLKHNNLVDLGGKCSSYVNFQGARSKMCAQNND